MRRFAIDVRAIAIVCGVSCAAALAQQSDEPREPLPSLDELLGIEEDAGDSDDAAGLPEDPQQAELERLLTSEEVGDAFRQAVRLMGDTAERLGPEGDTGLATQRMQEDVLRKLDQLIQSAKDNQNQSSSSSSSSQQQQQQQQQSQPQQPQQQQQQNSQGGSDPQSEQTPPAQQSGAFGPGSIEDPAAWGALPARLRDSLVQGTSTPFSSLYRSMAEAYYRRLAEEQDR